MVSIIIESLIEKKEDNKEKLLFDEEDCDQCASCESKIDGCSVDETCKFKDDNHDDMKDKEINFSMMEIIKKLKK